jgi:RNA polymerase sigma-70 factor (ECF subfamily)
LRHRYGDPRAFEELYDEFSSLVYSLSLRMCGSPERAQDLSQEVFLRIYKSLARFCGKSTLKTWIYRITLNHCRSKLGRKRWLIDSLDEPEAREVVEDRRGPEERALARDAQRTVEKALVQIDGSFREAVVLRDVEELSYQEIAEVLGVKIGTVRSRISRGRAQLKIQLEQMSSRETS